MSRSIGNLFGLLLMAWASLAHAAGTASFLDLRAQPPIAGDVTVGATKTATCVACHGPNGNPVVPIFPRLAGQHVDFLYWRLVAFKRFGPASSPMAAIVPSLTDADMRNLAAYFAAQTPADAPAAAPLGSGRGQELYLRGDSARGIPPCQGCHGQDARGPQQRGGPYAVYPALRAQQSSYVVARLTDFRKGLPQRTTSDYIMHGVARTLDDESIQAIANFIGAQTAGDGR
jgi:cytochrome c553